MNMRDLTPPEHLGDAQQYLEAAEQTTTAHRLDNPDNAVKLAIAHALVGLLTIAVEEGA